LSSQQCEAPSISVQYTVILMLFYKLFSILLTPKVTLSTVFLITTHKDNLSCWLVD